MVLIRRAGMRALALSTTAVLIVAACGASARVSTALERLRGMSPARKQLLREKVERFELQSSAEQQQPLRELDRRLAGLSEEERTHYFAVLRRYHNWLESLPERDRDRLQTQPPAERWPMIKTLSSKYPVPREDTPYWLKLTDLGGGSPFEVAAAFRTWQSLGPAQRRDIESQPSATQRREKLLESARSLKLPREIRPDGFRLDEWLPKVESKLGELRATDPESSDLLTRKEPRAEATARRAQELKDRVRPLLLRRLAMNLYFLEQPPPSVKPDRLAQFLAAMPPWLRSTFDTYPADEARRRLTTIYRLVYPHPEEFTPNRQAPTQAQAAGSAASKPTIPPPLVPPARKGQSPARPATPPSNSPF